MTAVTGFTDRNMFNQCLMFKYIISYEPYNFKGHLDDYPVTIAYGKKMDALRTELRDYFWDGEFRHEVGGKVTDNKGKALSRYSVFYNRKNKKLGMVICNYNDKNTMKVKAKLDNGQKLSKYRLVDNPEWKNISAGIVIPPYSAVVVI